MFLTFCARQQQLIALKNKLNVDLQKIQTMRLEYQSYSNSIGNGYVTTNDLTTAPSSVFGRMQAFSQQSTVGATKYAEQNINAAMSNVDTSKMAAAQVEAYKKSLETSLFNQARQTYVNQEKQYLANLDKKLNQQEASVQNSLTLVTSEEEKVGTAAEDAAKKAAPKYTA